MIILQAWRTARTWRELAYVLTGVVIALPPFLLGLLGVAFSTLAFPLLIGVLALARLTPRYFRGPARRFLGWQWANPPPLTGGSRWQRILAIVRDPTAWRALCYCLARWPLAFTGAYPTAFAVLAGPAAITYPLWWFIAPTSLGAFGTQTWSGTWWIALQGAAVLLALPWWLRLIVLTDGLLVRGLLQPSQARQRIAELEAGRAALQADATAMLRRIERDLHDGTQARLVALGLTLARIEHRSTEEPVRTLAANARGTVTEALAELRDIVRGMHPPALDDGLEIALTTLAARSAVPAEVTVSLTKRPPDATASALYFAVAELLTNVARHTSATRVRINLRTNGNHLRLTVTDNGHGGATLIPPHPSPPAPSPPSPGPAAPARTAPGPAALGPAALGPAALGPAALGPATPGPATPGPATPGAAAVGAGTGLAGLARRASALDGELTVDSPAGGPTTVTMTLPLEV